MATQRWSEMSDRERAEAFGDKAEKSEGYAIAFALMRLAAAQDRTATQIKNLGLADAATPMGALEVLSVELKSMAEGINEIASALRDAD